MRRLLLCLAVAAALVAAPAALADGPLSTIQGGAGVASHAHPGLHYVTVSDGTRGTLLERIDVAHGRVFSWVRVAGSWGIPTIGNGYLSGEGLSRDGRTSESGQHRIRAALHGNTLALEHIKQFLNYSNTVLSASESRCRTPRDQPRAEVSYGKALFLFTRMQPTDYSRENQ